MNGRIFDTHAHYNDEKLQGMLDTISASPENSPVGGIINCGTDIASSKECVALAQKYAFCYAAAGYHPEDITADMPFDKAALTYLAEQKKTVAIGEIGLDYHWSDELKQKQIKFFEQQLILARELEMPVIIHDRDAHGDCMELVRKYRPKGVMHCFSGSAEMAEELIQKGMYIGIGGVLTFKNSKKLQAVAAETPIERILLETDAPYMAPEPHRGETNRSEYIAYVAKKLAEIKNMSEREILDITFNNALTLFNI